MESNPRLVPVTIEHIGGNERSRGRVSSDSTGAGRFSGPGESVVLVKYSGVLSLKNATIRTTASRTNLFATAFE